MKARLFNELITVNKRATNRDPKQKGRRGPIQKRYQGRLIKGQIVYIQ